MNLMSVYDVLPAFAQNMAFSYMGARIQRTRFGDGFHKKLAEFESHNAWSRDQLVSWRNDRLKGLVRHCYDTVPFYRDVMDEGGINPTSIQDEDSLKALPVIRKADVKANPKAFVSSKAKNLNILHVHTSGTTGSGFQFDSTVECQQAQFACFWRYYHSHGLDANMWQAQFSSRQAVPKRVATPPFWRIDKPGKRYYMSAFHESPANMRAYYEVIQEKRFPWISGYPSLMVLLAQWMNERDLRFDFVKAVTCGAENLLEYQADAMEKAFGVRPVQTYGQTENVAIFSQSPDGKILVDEDFSVVEFSPEPVGGSASLGHAFSTTQRLFCVTTRGIPFSWAIKRGLAAKSLPSMAAAKIMFICRTARKWENSTTFSRILRIFKRLRFTRPQITPCACVLWGSRTYA